VVFNADASQLTNLAAVSAGYPLRGRCWSPANRSREVFTRSRHSAPGEAWPDSKLLAAVGGRVVRSSRSGRRVCA